jgi:hypothetical protein
MGRTHSGFNRCSKEAKAMYPSVVKVVPNDDYTLALVFDNGQEGVLDVRPYLDFGVFQRIKDRDRFKRVRVAFGTVEWDVGVDLDPEFVWTKCKTPANA